MPGNQKSVVFPTGNSLSANFRTALYLKPSDTLWLIFLGTYNARRGNQSVIRRTCSGTYWGGEESYYAISVVRRIKHPAVAIVVETTRLQLFKAAEQN